MEQQNERRAGLQNLVFALILVILLAHILIAGQDILLHLLLAIISVYLVTSASDWLGRLPYMGSIPSWLRRASVLLCFILLILGLASVVASTAGQLVNRYSDYEKNLSDILSGFSSALANHGISIDSSISNLWNEFRESIEIRDLVSNALGSVGSLVGVILTVLFYAIFLFSEQGRYSPKFAALVPRLSVDQTRQLVEEINSVIGKYLLAKTLVNIMLGASSYVVLWLFGVDFALFWAILIGMLNYIPYIGSLIAVAFPVLLTLAQFGSPAIMLAVLVLLTVVQAFFGNVLEPRLIGKQVNLSPLVVLLSLTIWWSMWGLAGAILAIPLTSIIMIVLARFDSTRPLAALLSYDTIRFTEDGGLSQVSSEVSDTEQR